MSRRAAAIAVAAAVAVAALAAFALLRARRAPAAAAAATAPSAAPAPSAEAAAAEAAATAPSHWTARLFYPSEGSVLSPEEVEVTSATDPAARAAAAVATLLGRAPSAPRVAPFSAAVKLGTLLLGDDGVAYVDLRSADGADPPASGSTLEILRVASVVHTVLRNVPEATSVVLLWNGRERLTFAGHLDTARAFGLFAGIEAP